MKQKVRIEQYKFLRARLSFWMRFLTMKPLPRQFDCDFLSYVFSEFDDEPKNARYKFLIQKMGPIVVDKKSKTVILEQSDGYKIILDADKLKVRAKCDEFSSSMKFAKDESFVDLFFE